MFHLSQHDFTTIHFTHCHPRNESGYTHITNTDETSPHGLPFDLLHRLLLVPTNSYTAAEIRDILAIRAKYEQLETTGKTQLQIADIESVNTRLCTDRLVRDCYHRRRETDGCN